MVDGSFNPSRHWYGSNVTGFTYRIDDGPVILGTTQQCEPLYALLQGDERVSFVDVLIVMLLRPIVDP